MNPVVRYYIDNLESIRSRVAILQSSVELQENDLCNRLIELAEEGETYEAFNVWLWQCSDSFEDRIDCSWAEVAPLTIMEVFFDWSDVEKDWSDVFDFISHGEYTTEELDKVVKANLLLAGFAVEDEFKAELLKIMKSKTKGFKWRGHRS